MDTTTRAAASKAARLSDAPDQNRVLERLRQEGDQARAARSGDKRTRPDGGVFLCQAFGQWISGLVLLGVFWIYECGEGRA